MKLNCKVEKSVPIKNFGYIFSFPDGFTRRSLWSGVNGAKSLRSRPRCVRCV